MTDAFDELSKRLNDDLKVLNDEISDLKKKHAEKSKELFHAVFKRLWEQCPNVKAVVWTQYTPYFNDGEPCEFGVHDKWIISKKGYKAWLDDGGYEEEYEPFSIDYNKWRANNYDKDKCTYVPTEFAGKMTEQEFSLAKQFVDMISSLDSDIYEMLFGDHIRVIATRKGFEEQEYDHD